MFYVHINLHISRCNFRWEIHVLSLDVLKQSLDIRYTNKVFLTFNFPDLCGSDQSEPHLVLSFLCDKISIWYEWMLPMKWPETYWNKRAFEVCSHNLLPIWDHFSIWAQEKHSRKHLINYLYIYIYYMLDCCYSSTRP